MRLARRIVAIVIGCAAWLVSAATVASATMLHDPVPVGSVAITRSTGAPLWEHVAVAALGVLLALAVVAEVSFALAALVSSLRRPRRSGNPLHA
jgi:ABC-type nitrate/sulfonate/bicarbonate transport system permease component